MFPGIVFCGIAVISEEVFYDDLFFDPFGGIIAWCAIIGFVVGTIGLFQKKKSRLLPFIGTMVSFIWIVFFAWLIYAMKDFDMNFGMGGF